jgi:hypothetical protein
MSLIKNIQLWNNQIPRQLGFDILDYCGDGSIGNSCTGYTPDLKTGIDFLNEETTANATHDSWIKSVDSLFLAFHGFFMDSTVDPPVRLTDCISDSEYDRLLSYYYGESGFLGKYKIWRVKQRQWFNCLLFPGDKQNGVVAYSTTLPTSPTTTSTWNYNVDFTEWQTPTRSKYYEYRNAMRDMMQAFKRLFFIMGNHPMTPIQL